MARSVADSQDPPYEPIPQEEWLRRKMAMMGGNQVNARRAFTRPELLNERIEHFRSFLHPRVVTVDEWEKREALYPEVETFTWVDDDWRPIRIGEIWGRADHICFFRRTIALPDEFAGQRVVLRMNVGGESTVFVNGSARDSLDPHRHEIVLADPAEPGQRLDVLLETHVWSFPDDVRTGTEADAHRFLQAEIATVDRDVEAAYYDFRVAYDAAMAQGDPERTDYLLRRIEAAMEQVDRFTRDRDAFKKSLRRGVAHLQREVYRHDAWRVPGHLCLVAHSHLDIAFHWWIHHGVRKTRRTMVAQLALMDRFPEFRFCQSQPKTFNDLKVHYPEVYERVKAAVKRGQLEPIGAMWIEPDGNLPSGESFVRQVLFGKRFWQKEFGVETRTCWLPDVFGCTWILPQILRRSGVEFFVTHKHSTWNDTNPWPYNLFIWRGPDGSEVMGCIPPTHFIGQARPDQLKANWEQHKQKHIFAQSMYNYGWGNGGGGPTADMVEYARRLRRFPGLPSTEITRAEEYLRRAWKHRRELPVWENELYLEMHRGTYTTKGALKRLNRQAEFALREAEAFSCLARISEAAGPKASEAPPQTTDDPAPEPVLAEVWNDVLVNQFHDILPGSHVHEVAERALPVAERAVARAREVRDRCLDRIASCVRTEGEGRPLIVFNSLGWPRSDIVRASVPGAPEGVSIVDSDGAPVPCQEVARTADSATLLFYAESVPAMGYRVFRAVPHAAPAAAKPLKATLRRLENAFFRLAINRQGCLASLLDKRAGRQLLVKGMEGNRFQLFDDQPGIYDAWDIAPSYRQTEWAVRGLQSIRVVESGPVRCVLRTQRTVRNSAITQDVVLYAHLPRVDFVTRVDWRERQKLLKVGFPVDVHAAEVTCDLDYGIIRRPTHRNTSWDQAKYEFCAHKWVDVSEPGYGVSLLNDGKYGYDVERLGPDRPDGNLLRLTCLKSSVYPDEWSDLGEHEFTYALYPHLGDWRDAGTVQQAYALNVPLIALPVEARPGLLGAAGTWLDVECSPRDSVAVGALKKAEDSDDLILRLVELHQRRARVKVRFGFEASGVVECDLLERDERRMPAGRTGFTFEIRPGQIRTFRLVRA